MAFGMKEIKELRERTGAGVLDCKKALQEQDGDVDAAIDYLREKGMAAAAKRAGRVAAEGLVKVDVSENKKQGLILEVNCETDFVAKNDSFIELVDDISRHIQDGSAETVEEALAENYVDDDSKTLETVIKEAVASIGENIQLRRFARCETEGFLHSYTHMGGKIGVLVEFSGEENLTAANNIAMHIAASSPEYLSRDDVSEEDVAREKKVYREQMLNEGKPENIIDNIVEGKMGKYYTQVCLLEQEYVRDTDISVGEYLEQEELEVESFVRYEVGEGIETEEEDFAEEVKAQMENN